MSILRPCILISHTERDLTAALCIIVSSAVSMIHIGHLSPFLDVMILVLPLLRPETTLQCITQLILRIASENSIRGCRTRTNLASTTLEKIIASSAYAKLVAVGRSWYHAFIFP